MDHLSAPTLKWESRFFEDNELYVGVFRELSSQTYVDNLLYIFWDTMAISLWSVAFLWGT